MTIIPDKAKKYQGLCVSRVPNLKGIECDTTAQITRRAQEQMIVYLAGIVAQRLFNPRTCRNYHAETDYQNVLDLATYLMLENELDPFLAWMVKRTENLLRLGWKAVETLAAQLIQRRTIRGADAREIIRTAPCEPRWETER